MEKEEQKYESGYSEEGCSKRISDFADYVSELVVTLDVSESC